MFEAFQIPKNQKAAILFAAGFFLMMVTIWVPFIPGWYTFIHMWRLELAGSLFLLGYLVYAFRHDSGDSLLPAISREELNLIVLPIVAFIIWGAVSAAWAPSWRSALHHSLIWAEYLIFYLCVRALIDRNKDYGVLISAMAATFVLFSLPAVVDYCLFLAFGGGTSLGIRFAKFGEQVNTFAPLLMAGILCLSGRRFAAGLAALALLWLLVFCSLSRMNIFLFICGTLAMLAAVFVFKRFHGYRRKSLIVAAVLILAPLPMHVFTLLSDDPGVPMVRRVGDEGAISSSNNFRKLMTSLSIEMIKARPLAGIGADNFGMQVNNYRSLYGGQHPDDVNLAAAENDLPERAHNEYLQILAELGLAGGLIFLWFLAGVALLAFRAVKRQIALIPIAAVIGVGLFLVSSLVSSYSFRFIQNGFVFFFVLAVAAKFLFVPKVTSDARISVSASQLRFVSAAGIAACLLLAAYSIIRVASVYYVEKANAVQDIDDAIPGYQTAMALDVENPNPYFYLGGRLIASGRYDEAAANLARTIAMGQGASPTYSYLATARLMSGDIAGAESTFADAVKLYPRSPFVLVRYAFFLKLNGKIHDSEAFLNRALAIDGPAAETWWTMMNEGTVKASNNASQNKNLRAIMDLAPNAAVHAVKTERELRFPEEKFILPVE